MMLLLAFALTAVAMRHLRQPETVARIGRLFPVADASDANSPSQSASADPLWLAVEDNGPFLAAETPAWLQLLRRTQTTSPAQIRRQSRGEVAYAQLCSQPDVYRGQAVRVSGTALRVTQEKPAPNEGGIDAYYRLVVAPRGGGEWPFVVYCLALPEEFPKGQSTQAEISVDGFFFKCWSYSYGDGLGIAPVIMAPNLEWHRPAKAHRLRGERPRGGTASALGGMGLVVAAAAGGLVAAWVALRTRRKRPILPHASVDALDLAERAAASEDVVRQLERLAKREAEGRCKGETQ